MGNAQLKVSAHAQVGFVTFVVRPLYAGLTKLVPDLNFLLSRVDSSIAHWSRLKSLLTIGAPPPLPPATCLRCACSHAAMAHDLRLAGDGTDRPTAGFHAQSGAHALRMPRARHDACLDPSVIQKASFSEPCSPNHRSVTRIDSSRPRSMATTNAAEPRGSRVRAEPSVAATRFSRTETFQARQLGSVEGGLRWSKPQRWMRAAVRWHCMRVPSVAGASSPTHPIALPRGMAG